jgi:anhydro-N-acetylmuramic acid kinase
MVYRVIGLMSGSSLDGLDIAYVQLEEIAGKWSYEIVKSDCYSYHDAWIDKLKNSVNLSALDYNLLHSEYGHYLGKEVNRFITENGLEHKVGFIASHGHTTFHIPAKQMTHQLGDGAALAAETGLPIISDLRALDVALGGQGAPIVPIGEKLLFPDYNYFLNIGGIANLSIKTDNGFIAFDVCPANRILNMLAEEKGLEYDVDGKLAAAGSINDPLLEKLNELEYYHLPVPKSLSNSFGTDTIYPLIKSFNISVEDALRTYTEHIAIQIAQSLINYNSIANIQHPTLFITGGGAFNSYLIERIRENVSSNNIAVHLPEDNVIRYKEALIMALIGTLRWREEYNVLKEVTGAKRDSISGAIWLGTNA